MLSLIFLVINNLLFIRFLGPSIPSAVDYDSFLDNASMIAGIRYALLDVMGVLFSIHLIQLALVIASPKRDTASWFTRVIKWPISGINRKSRKIIEAPPEIRL